MRNQKPSASDHGVCVPRYSHNSSGPVHMRLAELRFPFHLFFFSPNIKNDINFFRNKDGGDVISEPKATLPLFPP